MSDKIKILKQNLKKTIWFDEESHIYPYLFEERGNYKGKSKLLVKPNNTAEVSQILDSTRFGKNDPFSKEVIKVKKKKFYLLLMMHSPLFI